MRQSIGGSAATPYGSLGGSVSLARPSVASTAVSSSYGSGLRGVNGSSAIDWKRQPGSTTGTSGPPQWSQSLGVTPPGSFSSTSTRTPLSYEGGIGRSGPSSTSSSSFPGQGYPASGSTVATSQRLGSDRIVTPSVASSMRPGPATPVVSKTPASFSQSSLPSKASSITALPASTAEEEQAVEVIPHPAPPSEPPSEPPARGGATSPAPPREGATGSQPSSRPARKQKAASAEPQLLILRASYLSGLKVPQWWEKPASYMLSVHCGDEARSDPPALPGRFCTPSVQAKPPQVVGADDMELRQRVSSAISTMVGSVGGEAGAGSAVGGHECRFNAWIIVRLSEAGPGPAHGGPTYFRVDVWVWRPGVLAFQPQREFFGQVFVPLHNPEWQRRPCTWPVVDALGNDLAYLTCEFAFAHAPDAVRSVQVECTGPTEVSVSWRQPLMHDEAAPIHGYQVECCPLRRGQSPAASEDPATSAWQLVAEVGTDDELSATIHNLRGNTRYRFRVTAVNEAGSGDAVETEVCTGPGPPSVCGPPRLGGCSGPVLTVEWDAPADDGGAPIVGYWLWVRPHSNTYGMEQDAWLDQGHVRHNDEGGPQCADIHTEDLNPNVDRYLCKVAAVNAAGEVGLSSPDANALSIPNPCALCTPSPHPQAPYHATPGRLQPSLSMIEFTPGNGTGMNGFGHAASMQPLRADESAPHPAQLGGDFKTVPSQSRFPPANQEDLEDVVLRSAPAHTLPDDMIVRSAPAHAMADDVVLRSAPAHAKDLQAGPPMFRS